MNYYIKCLYRWYIKYKDVIYQEDNIIYTQQLVAPYCKHKYVFYDVDIDREF